MILERLKNPKQIKRLSLNEQKQLAQEIREFIVEKISHTGGHLASNLGVVELTISLFNCFNLPEDKLIWDVGHQSYTHKILSGRKDNFDDLRKYGGMSGFPKTKESDYDAFNTGHSSTSISAGLGMAQARDILNKNNYIVSVIGDGALTGGMAYEALNNAVRLKKNFIIVLNDNEMSISENVGGISQYLSGIRTGNYYNKLKKDIVNILERIPSIGTHLIEKIKQTKNGIKQLVIPGMLFENMGITYLGPVDGHDIKQLNKVFNEAKKLNHAVIVHVITKKGKGYEPAELNPIKYHGVGEFDISTGNSKKEKSKLDYTDIFSDELCKIAKKDKRVVAITAAMPEGTGLSAFKEKFPNRFFDVGIAEAHAVTSAAGMSLGGLKPVIAIYSSFLQRAFDQILHDVCIQNLHAVFAIDRAGLVGADGETHQGIFDLSYLGCIPNMTIMAPKNALELRAMLRFAVDFDSPIAIRYPRGVAYEGILDVMEPISLAKSELIFEEENIAIVAVGSMVSTAKNLREKLKLKGHKVSLINARFIKPIDTDILDKLVNNHNLFIIMEENVFNGGFGSRVSDYIYKNYSDKKVLNITLPDAYVEHGDVTKLRSDLKIDSDSILDRLEKEYGIK